MKLQSTPKPVRFRISSGGQEHSSLESLLSCFDYNELKDLKSKLIQWLERQGTKGEEIASQLKNCDGMPTFEDAIKMFYGYDCETMITSWFESKNSTNLQFIDLDLIKNNQRLLAIAYKNKELSARQIDDNQWLEAINSHSRITDIDLLNIKSKIELEIEKERLRKDFEKKQEEQKRKEQEEQDRREKYEQLSEEDNRKHTVKFYMGHMSKEPNYKRIAQITGFSESQLSIIYWKNSWSSEIVLSDNGIQALKPYVREVMVDGRYL